MGVARPLLVAAWAVVLLLCLPAVAVGHAVVEQTTPSQGAALDKAPAQVQIAFNEPVESSFGALRVFDGDGKQVESGELLRPSGESISTKLARDLPDGAYTVTYRVVSADSHPINGGFVFTVGESGGASAASVSDLLGDTSTGPVTEFAFGAVRVVSYAAIALLAGGALFLLVVWLPALRQTARPDGNGHWLDAARAFDERTIALMVGAAVAGLVATAAGIVLQAATATGGSFWSSLDSGLLHDVLNTRFGDVWKLRFTTFGVLVPLLLFLPAVSPPAVNRQPTRLGAIRLAVFAVALGYLVVSPAFGGHAAAAEDSTLLVPLDIAHVAAMSAWVAGIALLVLAVPTATRLLAAGDRTRLLAGLVSRFSTVALTAVAVLLATGVLQSILHLASFSDLIDTAFGRAILVKSALFVVLIGLGAYNRRRSQPRLEQLAADGSPPGQAGLGLRRALRAEIGLMVGVLVATAALVSYSPSVTAQTGPFSDSADLGAAQMELTVDPAMPGRNEIHVYFFDSTTGAQYDRLRDFTLTAAEEDKDIGPITLKARKAGPGHYTVTRADLAPAGDWTITARGLISRFDELRGSIEVPIR